MIYYIKTCEHFISLLYRLIFYKNSQCMIDKSIQMIDTNGDWHEIEKVTYMRIFGTNQPPHLLPKFILDKLVLQEIQYETYFLSKNKKAPWTPRPLCTGAYNLENVKIVVEEGEAIVVFNFGIERFKRCDPHVVIALHYLACKYKFPYTNQVWQEEDLY
jgi:hypothetical protein